jgi:hypothetical protein
MRVTLTDAREGQDNGSTMELAVRSLTVGAEVWA